MEQIKLQVLASYDNNASIDKSKLVSNLTGIGASVEGTDFPFLATLNKSKYTIYGNGETNIVSKDAMNIKKLNSVASSNTMTAEEKIDFYREFYGKTVNYPIKITTSATNNSGEGKGKWKIFYADENNIYLISDSRVELPYSSEDTSKNSFLSGYITYSKWGAIFGTNYENGVLPNYPINNVDYNRVFPTNITKYASESVLKNLNNSYYSQGFAPASDSQGLASLRAVISMIDTDVWSVYRDSKYAQYAIGGPSIEMFCNSYSQTHDKEIETKAFRIEGGNQYGYKVKMLEDEEYGYSTDNWTILSDLDNLYYKNEMYWFCSPSANTSYARIYYMGLYGGVNANYCCSLNNNSCATGFRPIICLKSNVQLEVNTNSEFDYVLK